MRGVDIEKITSGYVPRSGATMEMGAAIEIPWEDDVRKTRYSYGISFYPSEEKAISTGFTMYGADGEDEKMSISLYGQKKINYAFIGKGYEDTYLAVLPTGEVGFGTINPKYKVHVVGDIYCTGKVIALNGVQSTSMTQLTEKEVTVLKRLASENSEDKESD